MLHVIVSASYRTCTTAPPEPEQSQAALSLLNISWGVLLLRPVTEHCVLLHCAHAQTSEMSSIYKDTAEGLGSYWEEAVHLRTQPAVSQT